MTAELDLDDAVANVSGRRARNELAELRRERNDLKELVRNLKIDLQNIQKASQRKARESNIDRMCGACGWVYSATQDSLADIRALGIDDGGEQ